jgi:hypothetical protein
MTNVDALPKQSLTAYRIHHIARGGFPGIKPAEADRWWMDVTFTGWPNRCLPLRLANQLGWSILNDHAFEVEWTGSSGLDSIKFLGPHGRPFYVRSMFGGGILTWVIPYLFRTPRGWQLLVRGPANSLKDGIGALEGVVETDWSTSNFTMNWRFTRPGKRVKFEKDEPIATILPIRLADLEAFTAEIRNIESTPQLEQEFRMWLESRVAKVKEAEQARRERLGQRVPIQGHYVRGETILHEKASEHRAQLKLTEFVETESAHPEPVPPDLIVHDRSLLNRIKHYFVRSSHRTGNSSPGVSKA